MHSIVHTLRILELLQTHGHLSGADLAMRLNIERRTVRRYIVTLEEIGIPIVTERGRNGGYSLMQNYKLPPMMFTEDEASALTLGLLLAHDIGIKDSIPAITAAQSKLERVMPDNLKQQMRAILDRVKLSTAIHSNNESNTNLIDRRILMECCTSALNQKCIHLHYKKTNGEQSQRMIDPYGVAFYLGNWYLVGHCHLRNDMRIFQLNRIQMVAKIEHNFIPPLKFRIIDYLNDAIANIPRQFSSEILLLAELEEVRQYVPETMGALEPTTDGIILYNQSDDLTWLARQLAGLPFEFRVRHPKELHTELMVLAKRLMNNR